MSSVLGKRVKIVRDCGFAASVGDQGRIVLVFKHAEFALAVCLDKSSSTRDGFRLSEVRYLNNRKVVI